MPCSPSCAPYAQWALTGKAADILLSDDFIVEVGVLAKEQQDRAAIPGKCVFLHLPWDGGVEM